MLLQPSCVVITKANLELRCALINSPPVTRFDNDRRVFGRRHRRPSPITCANLLANECPPEHWTATTLRGFNSFSGYYTGAEHYFSHVRDKGYDFRKNENVDFGARGNYSTDLFNQEAVFWSFVTINLMQNKTRSELWRGRQAQRQFFFTWPIRCLLKFKTVDTKSRPDQTLVKFIHFPKWPKLT